MDLGLAGATAVVCGGTSGMGRAAALCLAEDGARIAVLGRDPEKLADTTAALTAAGAAEAVGLSADLRDRAAVDAVFAEVGERWDGLNILVNAAGRALGSARFEDWSDESWATAFDTLATAYVRTCRAAIPLLRKAEWARIVNISAHSTKRQGVHNAPYTAAKAAVTSLTKNLAKSLAPDGILVNTVSPGTILSEQITEGLRERMAREGRDSTDPRHVMDHITETHDARAQLGRAGLPDEIGVVVALLASQRNGYTTGADVNVDGGSDFC